jgi:N-methylhydantoinase A
MRIAIDSGGTFTDCAYLKEGRLHVLKVFSTPEDPGQAVVNSILQVTPAGASPEVRHGTTVGTNAMLERKGARVAFVTTAGFEDIISIGRQARPSLYDWFRSPLPSLVPDSLRFGLRERTSPTGEVIEQPSSDELDQIRQAIHVSGAESIALCLLFSFANPHNEQLAAAALSPLGLPISISHRILPEFREFERSSTVVTNAYLAPKVGTYIRQLKDSLKQNFPGSSIDVMQSSGGIVSARIAAQEPVRTVLSGPAGGVIGAYRIALQAGFDKVIGFDMGGTSTDVSLIDAANGGPRTTGESIVSEVPISVPMLDIHSVGTGGGSLARFDAGGILHVGPESAGSAPGPICYGCGVLPTVTDANLVLGRLDPDLFLGGKVRLDDDRTRRLMEQHLGPLASLEEYAAGILLLAETAMEKAIRVISIERGYDPREFTLISFGGAGPLHACSLAKALRISRVLVPRMPGALSALGILMADAVRDYSRTVMLTPSPELLEPHFVELEARGHVEFSAENLKGSATRSADLRYVGQGYEINVPAGDDVLEDFHRTHSKRYGYSDRSKAVEVVTVRVRLTATADTVDLPGQIQRQGEGDQGRVKNRRIYFEGQWTDSAVFDRDRLHAGDTFSGPALVTEYSATTVIPPGCSAQVDAFGNLIIEVN